MSVPTSVPILLRNVLLTCFILSPLFYPECLFQYVVGGADERNKTKVSMVPNHLVTRPGELQSVLAIIDTSKDNIFSVSSGNVTGFYVIVPRISRNETSENFISEIRILTNSITSPGNYTIPILVNVYSESGKSLDSNVTANITLTVLPPLIQFPSIPQEYLIGLYTLTATIFTGWFVPNFARYIRTGHQRKNFQQYREWVTRLPLELRPEQEAEQINTVTTKLRNAYLNGEINETHYEILREMISERYEQKYVKDLMLFQNQQKNGPNQFEIKKMKKSLILAYAKGELIEKHYKILREMISVYLNE